MLEKPLARKDGKPERAVLVGLITRDQPRELLAEYLDELEFLARTAHAETICTFTQSLDHPDVRTFVGKGKFQEITEYIEEHDIDLLIFDDELSPSQLRNLGEALPETKVLDRANLILDIFAQRARTAHAKTQVELAQYQYLLPPPDQHVDPPPKAERRHRHEGSRREGNRDGPADHPRPHCGPQKGPGAIDRQMATQRGNRGALVRVALVGYTNAGKSTLMNRLAKSEVFAEDKLFATLDTTVRKVVVHNLPFLLSDTVGFIRKLPHQLVESFKSTLDETRESDLLVHVVDVSHPQFEDQLRVVEETLAGIGAGAQRTMLLFNKIDQLSDPNGEVDREMLIEGLRRRFADHDGPVLFISAKTKEGMDSMREVIYAEVRELHVQRFPHNHFLY